MGNAESQASVDSTTDNASASHGSDSVDSLAAMMEKASVEENENEDEAVPEEQLTQEYLWMREIAELKKQVQESTQKQKELSKQVKQTKSERDDFMKKLKDNQVQMKKNQEVGEMNLHLRKSNSTTWDVIFSGDFKTPIGNQ